MKRPVLTVGSLFSGIGGFDLGLERAGMSITWQVENDNYAQKILTKHWPKVARYGDIKTIDWKKVEKVELVCGGFPCQPFSCAGKQRGAADNRYLWPEVVRCLSALRPTWFLGENVYGIINMELDRICLDLESLGYEVWPVIIPACAVDAKHIRKRVWILAHAKGERWYEKGTCIQQSATRTTRSGIARTCVWPKEPCQAALCQNHRAQTVPTNRLSTQSQLGRVAYGLSDRVDRLKGLGNAVVPQIVAALGKMITDVNVLSEKVMNLGQSKTKISFIGKP